MTVVALRLAGPLQSWGSGSRFVRRATDAAPQLVQLGQPELLGVLDQHYRGVGHIDPDFDDRRRDEHLDLVAAKGIHYRLLFLRVQSSMKQTHLPRRQVRPEFLPLPVHRLEVIQVGLLDARIDHINLAALFELATDELPDPWQFVGRPYKSLDPTATGRKLIDHRDVQVAVERQTERPGDGSRRHHQQMGIIAFANQLLPLGHAELVLLVDNDQAEVGQVESGSDQGMGADGERGACRVGPPGQGVSLHGVRAAQCAPELSRHPLTLPAPLRLSREGGQRPGEGDPADRFSKRSLARSRIKRDGLKAGTPAPDFRLPDVNGQFVSLSDFDDAEVLVINFTCNHCPTAQAYEDRFIQLVEEYNDKPVSFVAISPNNPLAILPEELG